MALLVCGVVADSVNTRVENDDVALVALMKSAN
jgi:hypothetical protein